LSGLIRTPSAQPASPRSQRTYRAYARRSASTLRTTPRIAYC
jgi:hypothetical protein